MATIVVICAVYSRMSLPLCGSLSWHHVRTAAQRIDRRLPLPFSFGLRGRLTARITKPLGSQ